MTQTKSFSLTGTIRVYGKYNDRVHDREAVAEKAFERVLSEANSNAQYDGNPDEGFQIDGVARDEKKYKLQVIYGETASREAADLGFKKTKKLIEAGRLEGSFEEYEFDTESDREKAGQILSAHDGWLGNYADIPEE